MIFLDTNILIEILKGNSPIVKRVENFNETIVISSISAMELYYGAINKVELKKLEKFIALFKIIHIDTEISVLAKTLIIKYAKSHNLNIPDSLIASSVSKHNSKLFTLNTKDFKYIENVVLV
ncbi:MAG: Unknown protein [uncultured Campylobacterales bacterium]|uniref:PIN domain-containing protein n=1 Tax=uncultured Campylobacterales bacterium TaxID=352960 RepID=A0A6S6SFN5_9BACT|nr:MAG: Unknown protein [uncultured Campylobacterales bacterium]